MWGEKKEKAACFVSFVLFFCCVFTEAGSQVRRACLCEVWASPQMDTLITSYCFFLSMSHYIKQEKQFILHESCYCLLTLLAVHILVYTAVCISLGVRTVFIKLSNKGGRELAKFSSTDQRLVTINAAFLNQWRIRLRASSIGAAEVAVQPNSYFYYL